MRRFVLTGLIALLLLAPCDARAQQPVPPPPAGMPMSEVLTWAVVGLVVAVTVWAAWPAEVAAVGAAGAGAGAGAGEAAAGGAGAAAQGLGATMAGAGQAARNGAVAVADGAGALMIGARDAAARGWQSLAALGRGGAAAAP